MSTTYRRNFTAKYDLPRRCGCYSLVIDLRRGKKIRIGKLGEIEFQPGNYIYTGSAMAGLRARLLRHLSGKKKLRWHIDYFLNDAQARIKKVYLYPAAPGQECRQNQKIGALPGAQFVRHKFGASDCRAGCPSHLVFLHRAYRLRIRRCEPRLRLWQRCSVLRRPWPSF